MLVTLIADDLTGACDAGAMFAGRGPVRVILGSSAPDPGQPVLVVDTESRALPAAEAAARVAAAAERIAPRLRDGHVFKKIDSTLRGPVGEELEVLRQTCGRRHAILCPAFPEQGRTVVNGVLRVHGVPAHSSPVGRDPAYRGATSAVAEILRQGGAAPVRHIDLEGIRGEREALARVVAAAGHGVITADAEMDADLDALAGLASRDLLLAGSAGLARAVARRLGHGGPPVALPRGGAWLFVAGSLHPATRQQVRALEAAGIPGVVVDPWTEPRLDRAAARLAEGLPVFVTTGDAGIATPDARASLAATLGWAAAHLVGKARPHVVAATGGETAWALLAALGADRLDLVGAPSSGLAVAMVSLDGEPPIALLTKAGGFGAPDLFLTLLQGAG